MSDSGCKSLTNQLTLITVVCDDLVELAEHFQVFDNVRVFVGDEYQEKFIDGDVNIADHVRLHMSALSARLDQFREVRHILLHFQAIDSDELACNQNLARLAADTSTDNDHLLLLVLLICSSTEFCTLLRVLFSLRDKNNSALLSINK